MITMILNSKYCSIPLFIQLFLILPVSIALSGIVHAEIQGDVDVTELRYIEREPGIDDYEVVFLVSDRYIRIDDLADESGYVVFDAESGNIYGVSHFDKSVLVIEPFVFSEEDSPVRHEVEYLELTDAPEVSGNQVYNYRVYTGKDDNEETCIDVQLVENLLPEVRVMLKRYQEVLSGQQVRLTDNELNEIQTACFYIDQVYNTGAYYDKGLPIQEWHSNGRFKALTSFKKISAGLEEFDVPDDYRRFSIDRESRTVLPER